LVILPAPNLSHRADRFAYGPIPMLEPLKCERLMGLALVRHA
jgi:hypothetical protein